MRNVQLPIIDLSGSSDSASLRGPASAIGAACRSLGFFYVVNHGVDEALELRLEALSREFFALSGEEKQRIHMSRGGRAWRGYFPVGEELTSGVADLKEGIYFGAELGPDDARVRAATPLHGQNLFPDRPAGLRQTVIEYMAAMTRLGHTLMRAVALSLDLPATYFAQRYTGEPFVLFRIFHYPPAAAGNDRQWGVGEHTDYGLLTILKQDASGGLQVKSRSGWIDAAPVAGSFVINIGDMLERMTAGLYRSTPHRVRNASATGRLSFPFFFDPSFDAEVRPIDVTRQLPPDDRAERWDGANVHELSGTYGDYLLSKVTKVFPELRRSVLP
ncbi:MAG TPA: 2-oxoglutarate and iron-dependent oxygenase domain-containing protein [Candidatus Acidoferrales bacterium]|nr:2-oxoglutarate and iron-dependent oxygenase domain-containing protein [Candidatus Acidoferrales bacterium]